MAYLEFLAQNGISVHMVANNISAVKASFSCWDTLTKFVQLCDRIF